MKKIALLLLIASVVSASAQNISIPIKLTWDPPLVYMDGVPVQPGDIQGYYVYVSGTPIPDDSPVGPTSPLITGTEYSSNFELPSVDSKLYMRVKAVSKTGTLSGFSNMVSISLAEDVPLAPPGATQCTVEVNIISNGVKVIVTGCGSQP